MVSTAQTLTDEAWAEALQSNRVIELLFRDPSTLEDSSQRSVGKPADLSSSE